MPYRKPPQVQKAAAPAAAATAAAAAAPHHHHKHHHKKAASPNVKTVVGGVLFAVIAVLWYVTTEDSRVVELQRNFAAMKVTTSRITFSHDGQGSHVWAKGGMNPSTVAAVPPEALVDLRTIMQTPIGATLTADNGSMPLKHLQATGSPGAASQGGLSLVVYSMYLATERRKGTGSNLNGMFGLLPTELKMHGGLYWTEGERQCAGEALSGEIKTLEAIMNATVATSAEACARKNEDGALREDLCGDFEPLTVDEARYALQVYLMTNFQDQAIVPVLSLAQVNNGKPGLTPHFDQKNSVLEIVLQEPVVGGEELTIRHVRGASAVLVSRGFFDKEAPGVEMPLRLTPGNKAHEKGCGTRAQDLALGANGRPRDALVHCLQVLTADEKLQTKVAKNPRKYTTPEAMRSVFGNLTAGIQQLLARVEEEKETAEAERLNCEHLATPVGAALTEFRAFYRKTLQANYEYVSEEYKRLADMTGVDPMAEAHAEAAAAVEREATMNRARADAKAQLQEEADASPETP